MTGNVNGQNKIAPDERYQIVCPYCFNRAGGGDGSPIPHTKVKFRSATYFRSVREIEQKLGMTQLDIEMLENNSERAEKERLFNSHMTFLMQTDPVYQAFWHSFDGSTTEQPSHSGNINTPWELPIIDSDNGIEKLIADSDGFVTRAKDIFGNTTYDRVCPFCHNPFPTGYGKNKVKYISIIGITGSGKTVYISQLLKHMQDYATEAGLSAFFTSQNERNFVDNNKVAKGVKLPASTSPRRLSQPMFYDIIRNCDNRQITDTIVLYDIAGENCSDAVKIQDFSHFVEHSDGIILLIDPKQLDFLTVTANAQERAIPSLTLNTLYNVLPRKNNEKCKIPIAVCVSKSDQCYDILPPIAGQAVSKAERNQAGLPLAQFDGRTLNQLVMGNNGLKSLMDRNAATLCNNLTTGYNNFNFFAVSATGCACSQTEAGFYAPVNDPQPKRIEEPVLWLFKQFGFIKSNTKVQRPFKIKNADRYVYKKKVFGRDYLIQQPDDYSEYEEDPVRVFPQVLYKNEWVDFSPEFEQLEIQ